MLDADTLELMKLVAATAAEKKAFDILALDISGLTSFTDAFLLCSASSGRHLQALADEILRALKRHRKALNVETTRDSWILIDYGDFILHLFTEERRAYFKLEALWGDAIQLSASELGIEGGEELS